MSKIKSLQRLQESPVAFRESLVIDIDGEPKPLAQNLDKWQAIDFVKCDRGWRRLVGQNEVKGPQRAYLERCRGASKTTDIAVMVSWALFASRRKLRGYAAAADKEQAALIRDAVDTLVRINPWLGPILKVNNFEVVNTRTGSHLSIMASDSASSYGLTPDFIICDEITHWGDKGEALFTSLFSAAAKRKKCLFLIISNAGYSKGDGWQWRIRETARQDGDWYFHHLDETPSWISATLLAEQKRLLPDLAYRRLWLNRWTSGSGDAISEADLSKALSLSGPLRKAEQGWAYFGGLDLGLSRDACAFAVVGKHVGFYHQEEIAPEYSDRMLRLIDAGLAEEPEPEYITRSEDPTGRIKLVRLEVWRPSANKKILLAPIEQTIIDYDEAFRISIGADPWQAAYLVERLKKKNVDIEGVPFVAENLKGMCSATLEAFTERQLALYDDPALASDLKNLRVVEKSYGVRLESPRGVNGHGDAATALSIALLMARKKTPLQQHIGSHTLICE